MREAGYTAVGEFHYLGLPEARAAVEAAAEVGIEIVLLLDGLRTRRDRPVPPGVARQLPRATGGGFALPACGSASPPTPCAPARATGSKSSGAMPRPTPTAARPRGRAAARDRGVPRRARPPPDRAPRRDGCLGPNLSSTPRTPMHANSTCSPKPARESAFARRPRRTSATASPPAGALRERDRNLHRLRLERAHRPARGAARAGGNRASPYREAQRRAISSLLCFGADEGAAALGLERWPDVEVNLDHPSLAGVDDIHAALVFGCSADVFTN